MEDVWALAEGGNDRWPVLATGDETVKEAAIHAAFEFYKRTARCPTLIEVSRWDCSLGWEMRMYMPFGIVPVRLCRDPASSRA